MPTELTTMRWRYPNSGQQHIIKNCVSIGGKADFGSADEDHNSWDKNFSASKSDFQAWTLRWPGPPVMSMVRWQIPNYSDWKATSKLVNAGTDVGLDMLSLRLSWGPLS